MLFVYGIKASLQYVHVVWRLAVQPVKQYMLGAYMPQAYVSDVLFDLTVTSKMYH